MLFMGGPAVSGPPGSTTAVPGAVVGRPLIETLRSTSDLIKVRRGAGGAAPGGAVPLLQHADTPLPCPLQGNAPLFKPACEFYKALADRARAAGHCVDVFACCLDQVGLLEMRPCVSATGGLCVLADSFGQSVFKESFRYVFRRFDDAAPAPDAGHLQMGFGATLEALTSRDYKISGALGPVCRRVRPAPPARYSCIPLAPPRRSLKRASPSVSEQETGEGGTCAWSLGGVDPTTSLAIVFDVAAKDAAAGAANVGKRHYLQLITYYQHSSGRVRMRVTTSMAGWWCGGGGGASLSPPPPPSTPASPHLPPRAATPRTRRPSRPASTRRPRPSSWRASP